MIGEHFLTYVERVPPDILISSSHKLAAPLMTSLRETRLPELFIPTVAICVQQFVPLYFAASLLIRACGFKGKARWEMASTFPSMAHGCVTFFVSAVQLCQHVHKYGHLYAAADNTEANVLLMQFSIAYFLCDTMVYIGLFARDEGLFALHHVVVSLYMGMTCHMGYGSISAASAMCIGESTSPLQNVWFIFRHARYIYKFADDVFAYLSYIYSLYYICIRSFIGVAWMGYTMYEVYMARRFPLVLRGLFIFFLGGGLATSQIWVLKIQKRLFQRYRPAFGAGKADHNGAVEHANGHNGHGKAASVEDRKTR